jgi:hypothetical protein
VDKKRRCSGAGQRCGNFAANVPGLTHTDDHDATGTFEQASAGSNEIVIDAFEQAGDCLSLGFDDASCESFDAVFIHISARIRRYPGCGNPNQYLISEKQGKQEES